ncbi:unnamed protein product [Larinioides sclopetarius]|uniref:Uncharacterized protein n=1 Tax=Larinioides sclopetarius TaxID=280406 RepID=A0AAV1Z819_9ARAC
MEKQLKSVLLLSLKEMALRRVAVILWSDSDISAVLKLPTCGFDIDINTIHLATEKMRKECRETIVNKVKDKVLKLELPESLRKQINDIVYPISEEIKKLKKYQEDCLRDKDVKTILPCSAQLCWTSAGAIHTRKTAEKLVRCEKFNVVQRYRLACSYCLEDYIPHLWEKLPEEKKIIYSNNRNLSLDLRFCWPHILKGELDKLDYLLRISHRNLTSFNQWAFESSAENLNKTAAEYFFQKLTREERETSLMRTAHAVLGHPYQDEFQTRTVPDLLCYLLSFMTPEQQMELVKAHPVHVLCCFLDWPWQDLFLENASLIWNFLPPSAYGLLLGRMVRKFEDHYFPKLFEEFFVQSPIDFKKCFVDEISLFGIAACQFLSIFFESEDSGSIEVVFRNVDAADRVKLIFHPDVFKLFFKNILWERWRTVEVSLREAKLSKEEKKRLRDAFTEFLERSVSGECVNRKFKRFFELLDETDANVDMGKKVQNIS